MDRQGPEPSASLQEEGHFSFKNNQDIQGNTSALQATCHVVPSTRRRKCIATPWNVP